MHLPHEISGIGGLSLLFLNVFLGQAGLPIPAYPTLLITGSLVFSNHAAYVPAILLVALSACVLADTGWYVAGQRYGNWLMSKVCKISLTPDTCVRRNAELYLRFGPRIFLVAKFLPGLAALSTLMAGAGGTAYRRFIIFDVMGSLIWVSSALTLGLIFHGAIEALLRWFEDSMALGGLLILTILAVFLFSRWWRRRQLLRRSRRIPRISAAELVALQEAGEDPLILDVRGPGSTPETIPGAVAVGMNVSLNTLPTLQGDTRVVIYCACPNEISAALLAERLKTHGVANAYALTGGLPAWREAQSQEAEMATGSICSSHG